MKKKTLISVILVSLLFAGCTPDEGDAQKISGYYFGVFENLSWSPDGKNILAFFNPIKSGTVPYLMIYDTTKSEWAHIKDVDKESVINIGWIDNETVAYELGDVEYAEEIEFYSKVFSYNFVTGDEKTIYSGPSVTDLCINSSTKKMYLVHSLSPTEDTYGLFEIDLESQLETTIYTPPVTQDINEVACRVDRDNLAFTLLAKNPSGKTVNLYSVKTLELATLKISTLLDFTDMVVDNLHLLSTNDVLARVIDSNYGRQIAVIGKDTISILNTQIDPRTFAVSGDDRSLVIATLGSPSNNSVFKILLEPLLVKK